MKVCKFGGTSNASASAIRNIKQIIKSDKERKFVVVSAPGKRFSGDTKVTDLLLSCVSEYKSVGDCKNSFQKVRNRFLEIVSDLKLDLDIHSILDETYCQIIEKKADIDFVASRGEYISAKITASVLDYNYIEAGDIIKFDSEGNFDSEYTNDICKKVLSQNPNGVIAGFYGRIPNGEIKTFSRGGSDISGAIIARATSCSVYENWTDVNGFMVADPRIVPNVKNIKTLSYKELRELAYMGANVLHEDAIFPVSYAQIPINIRNTFEPQNEGTMILPLSKYQKSNNTITGIAGSKGYSVINIEKARMNNELGFTRKVLTVVERYGISIEHIPTGIDTMSLVVESSKLEGVESLLIDKISNMVNPDSITVSKNLALIAIVGHGMQYKKGTASRLFSAIASKDVNIRMIDQGSSELNIIVGVDESDYEKSIIAIYDEFYNN